MTQPVRSVLPAVSGDVLSTPAPVLRADRVASLVEDVWGLRVGTVRPLSSERDANILLDGRYVLKVSNPAEDPAVVDMENTAKFAFFGGVTYLSLAERPLDRILKSGN